MLMSAFSDQSHQSLLSLYERTWEEVQRLREFEWRIAATFITLNGALIAFLCTEELSARLTFQLRWVLTVGQAFGFCFGIYSLLMTHLFLTQQRNIRRRIEEILRFYDVNVFAELPVLPSDWKNRVVRYRFQALGLVLPLILLIVIVQLLALYITWTA